MELAALAGVKATTKLTNNHQLAPPPINARHHQQITSGCREPIRADNNPTNKGINATQAYTPDATHSYGAQWTRDFA
jgi:hypothetical protein